MIESLSTIAENISSQYFAMVPVRSITWQNIIEDWATVNETVQQHLVNSTVLHQHSLLYPPSIQYLRAFLKYIIGQLELCGVDIIDSLYEAYTSILSQAEISDSLSFKTYTITSECRIVLQETASIVAHGTTGLRTWQAAQHFGEWILENQAIFENKNVLELGSGLGLAGLVACLVCQVKRFTFSDCHDQVLAVLDANVRRNLRVDDVTRLCEGGKVYSNVSVGTDADNATASGAVQVLRLDWEDVREEHLMSLCNGVDIIIAADVVYDVTIVPVLVKFLAGLLLPPAANDHGIIALICSTIRNRATHDLFLEKCEQAGLSHYKVAGPIGQVFFYERNTLCEIILVTGQKSFDYLIPKLADNIVHCNLDTL
jgi:predicted nicotinamide N-methyase